MLAKHMSEIIIMGWGGGGGGVMVLREYKSLFVISNGNIIR